MVKARPRFCRFLRGSLEGMHCGALRKSVRQIEQADVLACMGVRDAACGLFLPHERLSDNFLSHPPTGREAL